MDAKTKKQLEIIACKARMGVIEGTFNAKSGHPGGSLSICEVLSYLYFAEMNVDPSSPDKKDRDRFVLSKGHCAPALYSVLAQKGKAALENAELAKALAEVMEIDKVYTAAELAELGELANASKATAVAKVLVADGKAISEDVKGPKGKCKGYTLVEKYEG